MNLTLSSTVAPPGLGNNFGTICGRYNVRKLFNARFSLNGWDLFNLTHPWFLMNNKQFFKSTSIPVAPWLVVQLAKKSNECVKRHVVASSTPWYTKLKQSRPKRKHKIKNSNVGAKQNNRILWKITEISSKCERASFLIIVSHSTFAGVNICPK